MATRPSKPDAVEEAMALLVLDALVEPAARVLVVGADEAVSEGLATRGANVTRWDRFAAPGRTATPWPPAIDVDQAILRLPRVRASFDFALDAVATRLPAGGELWVVGTNDEGVRSAQGRMESLFEGVTTIDARRHGRLLRARRRAELPTLRGALPPWRTVGKLRLPAGEKTWVTYPGLFARGELDPASAFLLATVPPVPSNARVLDFGCGSGILGAALAQRGDTFDLDQLDADALAVEAARENLPSAKTHLGSSLDDIPAQATWDRVITNPPIHESVVRSYRTLEQFAASIPPRLRPAGEIWLVAQRQVPVDKIFGQAALEAQIADQRGAFRVWRGSV
jgi:16S rRNA (guanine1207-N2)-methyltransferase